MLCKYCDRQAKLICECRIIFCENHILTHKNVFRIKNIEDTDKLIIFSNEISQRIGKINNICCEIIKKTEILVKIIENLCEKSLKRLKNLKSNYINILEKGELKKIADELEKKIIINEVEFPNTYFIEKYYNNEFYYEFSHNKIEEGNLKNFLIN